MEEILASIRRIIADDQPLPGAAARDPVDIPMTSETASAEPPVVPSSQLVPMPPENGPVAAPRSPPPAESSGVMETPHPLAPAAPEPADSPQAESVRSSALENAFEISAPEPDLHEAALREAHDEPSAREAVLGTDSILAQIHETHVHEEQVREMLEHQVRQAAAEPPVPPRERPAAPPSDGLFSAATSQSLAAAFNTLAISRLADDTQELRGLARDMLQPLLKTWLDENLPGLVESIIREEIDRMARRTR